MAESFIRLVLPFVKLQPGKSRLFEIDDELPFYDIEVFEIFEDK